MVGVVGSHLIPTRIADSPPLLVVLVVLVVVVGVIVQRGWWSVIRDGEEGTNNTYVYMIQFTLSHPIVTVHALSYHSTPMPTSRQSTTTF